MIAEAMKAGGITAMKDPTRGGIANTLNEWCSKSKVGLDITEKDIPLRQGVVSACEMLGLDPQHRQRGQGHHRLRTEVAEDVLRALRGNKYGRDATIIGRAVESEVPGRPEDRGGRKKDTGTSCGRPVPGYAEVSLRSWSDECGCA